MYLFKICPSASVSTVDMAIIMPHSQLATRHNWKATFFPSFKGGPWINPTQPLGNNLKKILNDTMNRVSI